MHPTAGPRWTTRLCVLHSSVPEAPSALLDLCPLTETANLPSTMTILYRIFLPQCVLHGDPEPEGIDNSATPVLIRFPAGIRGSTKPPKYWFHPYELLPGQHLHLPDRWTTLFPSPILTIALGKKRKFSTSFQEEWLPMPSPHEDEMDIHVPSSSQDIESLVQAAGYTLDSSFGIPTALATVRGRRHPDFLQATSESPSDTTRHNWANSSQRFPASPTGPEGWGASAPSFHGKQSLDFGYSRINTAGGAVGSYNTLSNYNDFRHAHYITNAVVENGEDKHERYRQKINGWLRPHIVADARLDQLRKPGCSVGTREEILDCIFSWVLGTPMDPRNTLSPINRQCLCIVGYPGSGKTTIAVTIAERLASLYRTGNVVSASYFLQRGVESTTRLENIVPTLADQLSSIGHEELTQSIHDSIWDESGSHPTSHPQPVANQRFSPKLAIHLLLWPIELQEPLQRNIVIIIDGLDESADPAELAHILAKLLPQLPSNLRLILTSRPDHYIISNFGYDAIHEIAIELKTEQSYQDVHTYIATRFRSEIARMFPGEALWIGWPSVSQILTLAEQASGLFVWAATAVGFILTWVRSMGIARRDEIIQEINLLGRGLEDLGQLYAYVLESAVTETSRILNLEEKALQLTNICTLLGFLVVNVESPLNIQEMEAFLSLDRNVFDVHRYLQLVRSVVISGAAEISPSTVPLMHKTFHEFLTSERAGRLRIDPERARLQLFAQCMKTMLSNESGLRFNMAGLRSSFRSNDRAKELPRRIGSFATSQLKHACQSWGVYARGQTCEADLWHTPVFGEVPAADLFRRFLSERFLFWLEYLSLTDQMLHAETHLSAFSTPPPGLQLRLPWIDQEAPMDLETWIDNAIKFIREYGACMKASTPHIYVSALQFLRLQYGSNVLPSHANIIRKNHLVNIKPRFNSPSLLKVPSPHRWARFYPDTTTVPSMAYHRSLFEVNVEFNRLRWHLDNHPIYPNTFILGDALSGSQANLQVFDNGVLAAVFIDEEETAIAGFILTTSSNNMSVMWLQRWRLETGQPLHQPIEVSPEWQTQREERVGTRLPQFLAYSRPIQNEFYAICLSDDWSRAIVIVRRSASSPLRSKDVASALICVAATHWHNVTASTSSPKLLPETAQTPIAPLRTIFLEEPDTISTLCVSPNGDKFAIALRSGALILWDTASMRQLGFTIADFDSDCVQSVWFSADGKHLASRSSRGFIRVWDSSKIKPTMPARRWPHWYQRTLMINTSICTGKCQPLHIPDQRLQPNFSQDCLLHTKLTNGWIKGPNDELLLWIPKGHRRRLWRPGNTEMIPDEGDPFEVDLSILKTGEEWLEWFG